MVRFVLWIALLLCYYFGGSQNRPYAEVEAELQKSTGQEQVKLLIELCPNIKLGSILILLVYSNINQNMTVLYFI